MSIAVDLVRSQLVANPLFKVNRGFHFACTSKMFLSYGKEKSKVKNLKVKNSFGGIFIDQ